VTVASGEEIHLVAVSVVLRPWFTVVLSKAVMEVMEVPL
jgi:hypothetical protein